MNARQRRVAKRARWRAAASEVTEYRHDDHVDIVRYTPRMTYSRIFDTFGYLRKSPRKDSKNS